MIGARAGLVVLTALLASGCARPGYYAEPYDGAVPYDGTDPAAESRAARFAPRRFYPPPGPPSDPWRPYIQEAASRFRVPEQWVRAVMRQESGGREQAVSSAGAMGLMQIIPSTYETLRSRYSLGSDPFDPHDNVLAGAAYIREMYDRYGAPGFLAAYNAGPQRLDQYLAGSSPLPDETVNYLSAITPNLGTAVAFSGPLAVYAAGQTGATPVSAPSVASLASGCDPNAAYDPDRPCAPLERTAFVSAPVSQASLPRPPGQGGCDPDAAYDPDRPCGPSPGQGPSVSALYRPPPRMAPSLPTGGAAAPFQRPAGGAWAIQVGAFSTAALARAVAEGARSEAADLLHDAAVALPPTSPFGGSVLYRARLINLSAAAAASACQRLNQRQLPCVVVQPAGI